MNSDNSSMASTMALLDRMKQEMPDLMGQAQVVGKWVWLEFNVPPHQEIRAKLKQLGFHWNGVRRCWQHPCGDSRQITGRDPREVYKVTPASAMAMQEAAVKAVMPGAKEYKIVALRECPLPESLTMCDTPERAADYWRLNIATNPYVNPEVECLAVLMLNTRRRVKGHQLISLGTMDTLLVHPREVFRAAIFISAAALIVMHSHPSGDPTPSEADVKVTRDLIRAGQLLKIEVIDHVIIGGGATHCSLRELGYFASN